MFCLAIWHDVKGLLCWATINSQYDFTDSAIITGGITKISYSRHHAHNPKDACRKLSGWKAANTDAPTPHACDACNFITR